MDAVGGVLVYLAVYGFYLMLVMTFFFAPNPVTLVFLCIGVYMFAMRRNNDKEKD